MWRSWLSARWLARLLINVMLQRTAAPETSEETRSDDNHTTQRGPQFLPKLMILLFLGGLAFLALRWHYGTLSLHAGVTGSGMVVVALVITFGWRDGLGVLGELVGRALGFAAVIGLYYIYMKVVVAVLD